MSTPRFVHRVYTTAELEAADRCLVCDRATTRTRDADFGDAASTLYMTKPLPEVRLCEVCDAAQHDAMKQGRRAVVLSLVAAVALVLVVTLWAPGSSPFVVAAAGVVGLLASRVVIAHVRGRRARASRLLFVDGAEDEVVLQLRLDDATADLVPYRAGGRTPRTDGLAIRPVGPRVRSTIAFIGTTVLVLFACVIGGFGSYPVLVIDNPLDADVVLWLDGGRVYIPAGGRSKRTVSWGTHHLVGAGFDVQVHAPWGKSLLAALQTPPCYDIRGSFTTQKISGSRALPGAIYAFDQGEWPTRRACAPLDLPTW